MFRKDGKLVKVDNTGTGLTIVIAMREVFILVCMPRQHFNEIGDEGWDLAL